MELMKFYRFKDLIEAKSFYGRYTSRCGTGLSVSCCGKNYGQIGKPNVVFHLPDCSAPYYLDGTRCNLLLGLEITDFARDFCGSFSKTAAIFLGSDCKTDKHVSKHQHFYLTMDPDSVRYVMIAQKRSLNKPIAIPYTLKMIAVHNSGGFPGSRAENPDQVYWDYFIFPITFMHDGTFSNDQLQEMLHRGDSRVEWRRQCIAEYLKKTFGAPVEETPWVSNTAVATTIPNPSNQLNPVGAEHYEDNMRHVQTWVIDSYGRMLAPRATPDEASSFISATVALMKLVASSVPQWHVRKPGILCRRIAWWWSTDGNVSQQKSNIFCNVFLWLSRKVCVIDCGCWKRASRGDAVS